MRILLKNGRLNCSCIMLFASVQHVPQLGVCAGATISMCVYVCVCIASLSLGI